MLDILKFLFSGFWIWLGGLIYLSIIAGAISGTIIRIVHTKR